MFFLTFSCLFVVFRMRWPNIGTIIQAATNQVFIQSLFCIWIKSMIILKLNSSLLSASEYTWFICDIKLSLIHTVSPKSLVHVALYWSQSYKQMKLTLYQLKYCSSKLINILRFYIIFFINSLILVKLAEFLFSYNKI